MTKGRRKVTVPKSPTFCLCLCILRALTSKPAVKNAKINPIEPINCSKIFGSKMPKTWGPKTMPASVMVATIGIPNLSEIYGANTAIPVRRAKIPAGSFIEFI